MFESVKRFLRGKKDSASIEESPVQDDPDCLDEPTDLDLSPEASDLAGEGDEAPEEETGEENVSRRSRKVLGLSIPTLALVVGALFVSGGYYAYASLFTAQVPTTVVPIQMARNQSSSPVPVALSGKSSAPGQEERVGESGGSPHPVPGAVINVPEEKQVAVPQPPAPAQNSGNGPVAMKEPQIVPESPGLPALPGLPKNLESSPGASIQPYILNPADKGKLMFDLEQDLRIRKAQLELAKVEAEIALARAKVANPSAGQNIPDATVLKPPKSNEKEKPKDPELNIEQMLMSLGDGGSGDKSGGAGVGIKRPSVSGVSDSGAVVNGKMVTVGQFVDGFRVKAINSKKGTVTLSYKNSSIEIGL